MSYKEYITKKVSMLLSENIIRYTANDIVLKDKPYLRYETKDGKYVTSKADYGGYSYWTKKDSNRMGSGYMGNTSIDYVFVLKNSKTKDFQNAVNILNKVKN